VPYLAATAAVPLSAHPLRRRFAVLTTTMAVKNEQPIRSYRLRMRIEVFKPVKR
jgi:hypothetical protein